MREKSDFVNLLIRANKVYTKLEKHYEDIVKTTKEELNKYRESTDPEHRKELYNIYADYRALRDDIKSKKKFLRRVHKRIHTQIKEDKIGSEYVQDKYKVWEMLIKQAEYIDKKCEGVD